VICKEECLVTQDRATQRGPEIVSHQEFRSHVIECVGVEGAISQELVCCSMKLVGSGPGDYVDLAAAGTTHFGGVAAGLDLELLNGVRGWAEVKGIEGRIGVGCAVKQEKVSVGPVASNTQSRTLSRPPIQGIHVARLGAVAHMGARHS